MPRDWVVATGESHTVRDFVKMAFKQIGIIIEFQGKGLKEVGIVNQSNIPSLKKGQIVVRVDKNFFRPLEVNFLTGNPARAKKELGWKPEYTFEQLVKEMVNGE